MKKLTIKQLKAEGRCVNCHYKLARKMPQCISHEVRAGREERIKGPRNIITP